MNLGHASVSFTLDTDGHVMPGQQAEAAAAAASLLGTRSEGAPAMSHPTGYMMSALNYKEVCRDVD